MYRFANKTVSLAKNLFIVKKICAEKFCAETGPEMQLCLFDP